MDGDWLTNLEGSGPSAAEEARRRLLRLGARALSNAELIGVLLGGEELTRAASLVEQGLKALLTESPEALIEFRQLSAEEASRVLAAGELARRLHAAVEERPRLQTPQGIYEWARKQLVGARREEFHVLCLNSRNVLLRHACVAVGSIDQCHVDPREVLAPAITARATGIVLLHNHPSGDPEPSVQDVALTRQLREGARLLCLRLLDHIVVGETGFVSMLARGLIKGDEPGFSARLQSP
ncbi:MAG: DNA repair protein RadC [Archangium sp.]|nr:DNA repair protein RadC [Archangium sp.]MDP3571430.1 DNA repair protein RadC [Archangium sp.]